MYRAKARTGESRIALFDLGMHAQVLERLEMEAALRKAVGTDEIRAYYQPIVDLADQQAWPASRPWPAGTAATAWSCPPSTSSQWPKRLG